jgi:hypothetical protein
LGGLQGRKRSGAAAVSNTCTKTNSCSNIRTHEADAYSACAGSNHINSATGFERATAQ